MKKFIKLVVLAMFFSMMVLSVNCLAATGSLEVSTAEIMRGETTTVSVDINMTDNPGLIYAKFIVTFPDEFTLTGVSDKGVLGSCNHSDNLTSPHTLYWHNGTAKEDFKGNGTIATLTFEVSKTIQAGTYPITVAVDQGNTFNYADEDVEFSTASGGVIVNKDCDINSDGTTDDKDAWLLARYLCRGVNLTPAQLNKANFYNNDEIVNIKDLISLVRALKFK